MFIGHAAVGFASKAAAPRASLGVLLAAPAIPLQATTVIFGGGGPSWTKNPKAGPAARARMRH
jgi:hypothetical protein